MDRVDPVTADPGQSESRESRPRDRAHMQMTDTKTQWIQGTGQTQRQYTQEKSGLRDSIPRHIVDPDTVLSGTEPTSDTVLRYRVDPKTEQTQGLYFQRQDESRDSTYRDQVHPGPVLQGQIGPRNSAHSNRADPETAEPRLSAPSDSTPKDRVEPGKVHPGTETVYSGTEWTQG